MVLLNRTSFFPIEVDKLEDEFKKELDIKFTLAVNNATNGLFLAYKIFKRKNFNNVTINPLVIPSNYSGANFLNLKIIAAPIDHKTLSFDLDSLEKNSMDFDIVSVTHYFGYTCDMERLALWCKVNSKALIEDCSHCHGGVFNGKKLGTFGDISVFSLQGSKFISGGEGGIICTNNEDIFRELCQLAFQDKWLKRYKRQSKKSLHDEGFFGLKYRMHPLAAGLALIDIKSLNLRNRLHRKILNLYSKNNSKIMPSISHGLEIGGFCNGFAFLIEDRQLREKILRNKFLSKYIYTRDYRKYFKSLDISIADSELIKVEKLNNSLIYTNENFSKNFIAVSYLKFLINGN